MVWFAKEVYNSVYFKSSMSDYTSTTENKGIAFDHEQPMSMNALEERERG